MTKNLKNVKNVNKNKDIKKGVLLDTYNNFRKHHKEEYMKIYNTLNFINLYNLTKNNTLELSSIDKLVVKNEDIQTIKQFARMLLVKETSQKLEDTSNTTIKNLLLSALIGACKITRKDTSTRKDTHYNYHTTSTISVFEFFRCLEKLLVVSVRVEK